MANHKYGEIKYNIKFDVDKGSLQSIETELQQIQNMTTGQYQFINPNASRDLREANKELIEIKKEAKLVEDALGKAFNPKLDSINLVKFNQQLSNINIDKLYQDFMKVGPAGEAAFIKISNSLMQTNIQMRQSSKLLDNMATSFKNTIKWGISSSVFNSLTGALQKSWGYVQRLDKSLNDIRIVSGKSADEMERFARQANVAAQSLGASTLDYTNASLIYFQQGLSSSEVEERANITVKMANTLGATASEVSDYMTAIWNNFDNGSQSLEYYADVITALGAATASSAEEISDGLEKFAAVADTVGLSYEYATSALATVVAETRQSADVVGTAFKTLFARIQDLELGDTLDDGTTLGKYSEALLKVGINIKDQNDQLKDMDTILNEIGVKWQVLSKAQQVSLAQTVAGTRQYTQLIALMDNWDTFQENLEITEDATGTLNRQQAIYMESTEAHLERMSAAQERFINSFSDKGAANGIIDFLTGAINLSSNFIESIGGGSNALLMLGSIASQVFSKQIAASLNIAINNLKNARLNTQLMTMETERLQKMVNSSAYKENGTFRKQVDAKIRLKTANPDPSQEESKVIDDVLNRYTEVLKKQQNWNNQLGSTLDLFKQLSAILGTDNFDDINDLFKIENEDYSRLNEILDKIKSVYKDNGGDFKQSLIAGPVDTDLDLDNSPWEILRDIEISQEKVNEQRKIYNDLVAQQSTKKQLDNQGEAIRTQAQETSRLQKEYSTYMKTVALSLKANGKGSSKAIKDLLNSLSKYENSFAQAKDISNTNVTNSFSAVKIAWDNLLNDLTERAQQALKVVNEEIPMALEENIIDSNNKVRVKIDPDKQGKREAIKDDIKDVEQEINILEQQLSNTKITEYFVNIAGAVGQITSALQTLSTVFTVWNDESLSTGEKILQFFMSLGTALPLVINGYKTISTSVSDLLVKMELQKNKQNEVNAAEATDIVLKKGQKAATDQQTAAQIRQNAAMAANPIIAMIMALTALIGVVSLVTNVMKKNNEALQERNNKNIEAQTAIQKEIDANYKLYNSWEKMYDQYKLGTSSKEELAKSTEDLIDLLGKERVEIANLTGDYESLNTEIVEAQKKAAQEGLKSAESERGSAASNLANKAREGRGHKSGNQYKVEFSGGWSYGDEEEMWNLLKDIGIEGDISDWGVEVGEFDISIDFNEDNIVKLYDQLDEFRTRATKEYGADITNESELFKNIDSWLNKMTDSVDKYKTAVGNVTKYQAQLDALKIDFSKTDTYEDFTKKRQNFIETIKKSEEFKNKDIKEVEKEADKYITELGGTQAEEYLRKLYGINYLKEQFPNESKEALEQAIGTLTQSELSILISTKFNKDETLEEIKDVVNLARHEAIGAIDITDLITGLQTGKVDNSNIKDNEQYKELITELDTIKDLYPDVQAAADELTRTWTVGSQEYIEALEIIQDKIYQSQVTNLINKQKKELEEFKKKFVTEWADEEGQIQISINVEDGQFQTELNDILNADYAIDVAIHTEAEQEFDNAIAAMDDIYKKAGLIGENFIVAADDIRDLNNTFPGIIENMKDMGDGTVQLNKQIVKSAIESAQTEVAADVEATAEKLHNQATLLRQKQTIYQQMADAAKILAESETGTDEAAKQAEAEISDGLAQLEQLNKQTTEQHAEESDAAIADSANVNAGIVAKNWRSAYQTAAEDSYVFAKTAAMNMKAAAGRGNAVKGSFGANYQGSTGETAEATVIKDTQNLLDTGSANGNAQAKWAEIAAKYQQLANSAGKSANDIEGMIAGLGAKTIELGNAFGNIKAGKSSSSDPNLLDYLDDEADRYHKVNTQIDKVDNALKKLQSQTDKFAGSKLIDNLNNQWALLNTQIDNYNEKLRIAYGEQEELRQELSSSGVTFNDDGTIANYFEVFYAQEARVNEIIANYNSMSKGEQEIYQDTVDVAKEQYEKFQENLDRYDELVSDFIPGLQQNIQDAIDEQIEINIQKFNMEIEITLDMTQATRDWNEWKKRAIDGIDPEDVYGNANARLQDFYTYFNEAATAEAQVGTRHLNDTLEELYKMDRGENNIYGDNRAQALEYLRTYYTQLMQSITDVIELQDELHQDLLDEMDEVQEKFDEQIASYEFLRDLINHDIKVIQLTFGEDAYGEMAKFYEAQQNNYEKQLDFQRQQKDFWYAQMQAAEEGTEEWESARDKWKEAINEFNSVFEEGLENAANKFENAINNIFKTLNNQVTNGMGLDFVNTQWDLINKNADRYLDTINATYGIRELEKKYVDSINSSDMVSVQQRLKKLMDEQLDSLKAKDRLTQYDLDRANKLYEIELARIALEEAQRNKSQMRLRRDSQGNYTYQYVADNDAISDAENQLSNLYNDLYNFDKDRYNQVLSDIYSIWDEYQQAMAAAALINDPELRAEKERLIQEQYNELMMQAQEDYEVSKYDLQESFFWDWVDLNNMTLDQFKALTENEKDIIMVDMVPTWENGITQMMDAMVAEGGFAPVTQQAWLDIKDAENQYAEDMAELEAISGQTFETIINGEDDSIDKAKDLVKVNDELIDAYGKELAAVQSVYDKVRALRQEYEAAEIAAKKAAQAAYEYEQKELLKQQEDAKNQNQTTNSADASGNSSTDTNSSESGAGAGSGSDGGNGTPEIGETVTYVGGKYYASSYGDGPTGSRGPGKKVKITAIANGRPYPIHVMSSDSAYGWLRQDQLSGYDTGGYTGDWNNSGRLALLHQKELVLNAEDTKNMLNTVAIMRSLAYSLGSNMLARLAGATANSYNGSTSDSQALEQNVHIKADFPNVRDAKEIEQALNNLVNAASQRIYEK